MNALSIMLTVLLAVLLGTPAATGQTPAQSGSASQPAAGERAKPHPAPAQSTHAQGTHAQGSGGQGTPAGKAPSAPVVTASPNAHALKPAPARQGAAARSAEPAEPARAAAVAEPPKGTAAEPQKGATAEPPKGGMTGLPLPRWASLKSDEVNLRKGPGTRYPIEWVYRRHDLPVQIEREYEVWRLVEDQDGVKGWVHQANLTGRRSFVVKGSERTLRRAASEDSAVVARLHPGVVGRLRACEAHAAWCEVQVGDYRGWLKRDDIFGVYPGEAVN